MSALADFATLVVDTLGGRGMELDRRTAWSPVALRVWLPDRPAANAAVAGAKRLGLYPHIPVPENPHGGRSSYQLVVHLTPDQIAEARAWLARGLPPGQAKALPQ